MNRTEALIAAITASLLAAPHATAAQDAQPVKPASAGKGATDAWKTDAAVGTAADSLYDSHLRHVDAAHAETRAQIAAAATWLGAGIDDAIRRLKYDGRIKQLGRGTDADPFRYYGACVTGCG